MNGAESIVETLIRNGTDITFGFPGGKVIPLFDAYLKYKGKIRNILVRHEQAAAHAAEGYARASGRPGVCIATSGPGACNLVTGIADAFMDSTPIIAMGGQVQTFLIGNDAFQETDMMGITIPITKHNFQARSPDDLAPILMKSYKISKEGRPGPVYIDLPSDTQLGKVTKEAPKEVKVPGFQPTLKPSKVQIKKAVDAIKESEQPVFLIGQGVIIADASDELHELARMLKIPVATTYMAKGAFDEYDELSLGSVGMHGRKIANYATMKSDLLITIGCRFSDRITGKLDVYAQHSKVIHADIDPAEIGKNVKVDIPIVGDAKAVLKEMIKEAKKEEIGIKEKWVEKIKKNKKVCDSCIELKQTDRIQPRDIMVELNSVLKPEDIVVTGVGQHQMFAGHFLKMRKPRTFITSGGAGTMGYGFPASLGAKVAKPDSEVFLIDGDGSFQMTLQELATAKEAGIKVIIIIMNNSWLGMVRQWLELFFDKRYSEVHLGEENPDFVKLVEAYGLRGIRVKDTNGFKAALQEAIKSKETVLIDVMIEKESNILPMLPPGGKLKDAFGGCMAAPGKFFEDD